MMSYVWRSNRKARKRNTAQRPTMLCQASLSTVKASMWRFARIATCATSPIPRRSASNRIGKDWKEGLAGGCYRGKQLKTEPSLKTNHLCRRRALFLENSINGKAAAMRKSGDWNLNLAAAEKYKTGGTLQQTVLVELWLRLRSAYKTDADPRRDVA